VQNMAPAVISEKSFDDVTALLEKAVPENNFRVPAIHDVKATLAEKDFEIDSLKIFEVRNAGFAYMAIKSDVNAAMFMPCKIVVRPDSEGTSLTLVRPSMIAEMLPEAGMNDLADEVEKQLIGIIDEVK